MERPAAALAGLTPAPAAKLEPDAIGTTQDTIIGMASSAPAATMAVTMAGLAAAAAYGGGPVILLCGIPMLIIANSYRRLNLWNANCGASFEWVGRAINPYLGFMTGWLMLAGYVVGSISVVVALSPAVLAVFNSSNTSAWPNIGISTALILVMLVIAVAGIRITARTQVGMAVIEYIVLVGISIGGLVFVLSHHAGTFPITRGWFSLSGIDGEGQPGGGPAYRGLHVLRLGRHHLRQRGSQAPARQPGPGRRLRGRDPRRAVHPAADGLAGSDFSGQAAGQLSSVLIYVTQVIGGSAWAKIMAFALVLSVIGSTGTGIVASSRISSTGWRLTGCCRRSSARSASASRPPRSAASSSA